MMQDECIAGRPAAPQGCACGFSGRGKSGVADHLGAGGVIEIVPSR
jgi:hypothetical protein